MPTAPCRAGRPAGKDAGLMPLLCADMQAAGQRETGAASARARREAFARRTGHGRAESVFRAHASNTLPYGILQGLYGKVPAAQPSFSRRGRLRLPAWRTGEGEGELPRSRLADENCLCFIHNIKGLALFPRPRRRI